jgi:hypothetical protein
MPGVFGKYLTLSAVRALIALGLVLLPLLQLSAASPAGFLRVVTTSQSEEEKPETREFASESSALARGPRPDADPPGDRLPVGSSRISDLRSGALARAASIDPFRNGLGCPFRC